MDDVVQQDSTAGRKSKANKIAKLLRDTPTGHGARLRSLKRGDLSLGIDIGSTSSDIVLLDGQGRVVYCNYQRTMGKPIETARLQLEELFKYINPSGIRITAATGSAGRLIARLLGLPFVNEVPAQAAAIAHLYPHLAGATIIEMGGQDSKLIFLSSENGKVGVRDFALNTVCAAGTGAFLDQQAQRLGVDIEDEFGKLALKSKNIPRMAGRCSVFAKSDMIHLQQQATPDYDIIAGLCLALARNLKSNLGCGREFVKPIVFTGGVAANIGVVRSFEEVFELPAGRLIVPDEHFFTGAIGAVLVAKTRSGGSENNKVDLVKIDSYIAQIGTAVDDAPRRVALRKPALARPVSKVYEKLLDNVTEPINCYLGVDVGSISTNVVVMDPQKRVLAKAYLMTAGRPLEAVRRGLDIVGKKVAGKVNILGAATTGSGRYLTGDFIGADVVINEITAQAAGAAIVNPEVDTIFEIGGQDSKYISLENGVVVDFEMNHACAAGTGSFLEEQSQRLGISINNEFARLAFASDAPIKLGERCTVFMESDLLNYHQQGAKTSELVAGLSYSIVANYLNRVVGRRKIGENICFQGGTAFNRAVLAAFEQVTGKKIMVPDHHEVTGALGAASIAAEHMKKIQSRGQQIESSFRGFENLVNLDYSVQSFACEHCSNNCEIKEVQLPGSKPLYYGSRCDRYNIKKKSADRKGLGAFEYRRQKLLEYAGLSDTKTSTGTGVTIGIPAALVSWQLLPLFSRFFKTLGFDVVLSGKTSKRIIRMGVESVTAQPCFPVKVAYGHVEELINKKVDHIFLPSIVSMTTAFAGNKRNQLCPYVQSFPYQVRTAFADKLGKTKILSVPIRLGQGRRAMNKSFIRLAKELSIGSLQIKDAVKEAFRAQDAFEDSLKQKGAEILSKVKPGQKLFVMVSRPYNGCDEGLNLELPRKMTEHGVDIIPMDMLDLNSAELGDKSFHNAVYWSYGQKILRAAEIIKRDPRLFAVYLTNFSCGPDSFLLTFFKDIMSPKPCLLLELDEHSADAGVITRLEAFLESLKHYQPAARKDKIQRLASSKSVGKEKTLYIPYMGDCAYGVAACFRAYGQSAEVMPMADEASLIRGRQFTSGKECLPCAITAGDMLTVINSKDFDPEKAAFFMPGGRGPCRFGMYNCLHKLILRYAGQDDVRIIAPNQDGDFYHDFTQSVGGSIKGNFMKDIWIATVGVDLMYKLLLRTRPFAKDTKQAQKVYEQCLKSWVRAVEKRVGFAELVKLCGNFAEEFASIEFDYTIRKPMIGIVGEIYVRSHPFANKDIITRLEELGAVCDLASLAEWIYYTNFTRKQRARINGNPKIHLTNLIQNKMQHKIEKTLAEPFEKRFGLLAEEPIEHVIALADPYLHNSFEGE
ncbi:MAG: acyl-CoA dehydratase activase, partial [Planctomycetota bacterium]